MKELLEKVFIRYEINTPLRKAHFMAQVNHESAGFTKFVENLNYSVTALLSLFSRKRIGSEACQLYGRTPSKKASQETIANIIYGGDWGKLNLGNLVYGDGWKHRGAGAIQLTGKANQEAYFKSINEPCEPSKLQTLEYSLDSAGWFWKKKGLNELADKEDFISICTKVNGGDLGLSERQILLTKYKKEYGL